MIVLKTILLFFSGLGYCSFISARLSNGLYKAPFLYCCASSLLIYVFSLLDLLKLGVAVTTGLGLIFFAVSLRAGSKRISATLLENAEVLLIAIPYLLLYMAIKSDFEFLLWDEFSYWASSAKVIATTDALFNENSPIFFKSYPPAQQLLQYYFVKATFWSEKNVLFAEIFWTLSAILCCLGSIVTCKRWVSILFMAACSLLYFFDYSLATIYSDALLGCCFGASLGLAYDTNQSWRDHFVFFLSLASLLLVKEIAIALALIAIVVFSLEWRWQQSRQTSGLSRSGSRFVLTCIAGLGLLAAVRWSWSWYTAKIKASREITFPSFVDLNSEPLSHRISTTLHELGHRLFETDYLNVSHLNVGHHPSIWHIFVAFIVLSVAIVVWTPKSNRGRVRVLLTILPLGGLGYLAVLLISYLVIFTEYEGTRLASFERYLSSYFMAWALILFAFLSRATCGLRPRLRLGLNIILSASIVTFVPTKFFKDFISIQSSGHEFEIRKATEAFANQVKKHVRSDQKTYFIAQNSNGLERVMFYYAMLPYETSMSWCWSLGKKYFEGDVWTCDTPLVDLMKDYDYLALYRADKQFWDLFAQQFDAEAIGRTAGVFRIIRTHGVISKFELENN